TVPLLVRKVDRSLIGRFPGGAGSHSPPPSHGPASPASRQGYRIALRPNLVHSGGVGLPDRDAGISGLACAAPVPVGAAHGRTSVWSSASVSSRASSDDSTDSKTSSAS